MIHPDGAPGATGAWLVVDIRPLFGRLSPDGLSL
jgi:hypothetical protein